MEQKRFLDMDGLRTYDTLIKKYISDMIDSKLNEEDIDSKYNDVKTYSTRSAFPSTGFEDVMYISLDDGLQYIWNGSEYSPIEQSITSDEILDILV